MKQRATLVAVIGLLLLTSAVTAMSQTRSTPGTEQAGGVSSSPVAKAVMPAEPEADSANADPAGRYDWKTSYDFHSALPSHDSRIQGNLTAEARPLDMAPIETSLPYLTVASKGSEHEFSSTYGSGGYDWTDFSEFNAKVAYAKSRIVSVHNSGATVNPVDETPSSDENYTGPGVAKFGGAAVPDATGLSTNK